jgi:hypothetical protein
MTKNHPILFNIFKKDPYFSAIIFRTIVFGLSSVDTYYMYKLQPKFIMFATNWGQMLTNLYYLLALLQAIFRMGKENAFTRVLSTVFHIALSFEFLIFIFYWPKLSYEDFLRCLEFADEWRRKYEFACSIWRHLVNPLVLWMPLLTNYTKFQTRTIWPLIMLSVAYMYNNYYFTQKNGEPVYPGMDWASLESLIQMILAIGLTLGGFYTALGVSRAMRKRFALDSEFLQKVKQN